MAQSSPPLFVRRLRALWRRLSPPAPRPKARAPDRPPIQGFVDGCVAGEIRGWALDRREPGRRVHVVAVCDGRVVAESLADITRMDLIQNGHGDGRHAFRLKLPPALLDGAPRTVQVEAVMGGPRVRLTRGEVEVAGPEPDDGAAAPGPSRSGEASPSASVLEPLAPAHLTLVAWGPADRAGMAATRASAEAQHGPSLEIIELEALRASGGAEALRRRLEPAGTVVFARAGDLLDPALAAVLGAARPLADVLTWESPGPAGRRPEARALGVLLGESLGGAFAVRGHALLAGGDGPTDALLEGDLARLERLLAARPQLRWSHLAAPLSSRPAREPHQADSGFAPPGFRRRPGGLAPEAVPDRWSVGLWPAWTAASEATLRSLLSIAPPDVDIELLVDAAAVAGLQGASAAAPAGVRVTARPVDLPAGSGAGAWLQALGAAATGEVLIVCQAGLRFEGGTEALQDLAAWSQSPLVGAVTGGIRLENGEVLAGLAAARVQHGWAARSAYEPASPGRRPVLAAPAALLGVSRAKLAALGGFDGERLGGPACSLDLALRLRRMGAASVLLDDLRAAWSGAEAPAGETEGAALAAFDSGELAAAACAYPAPDPPR